MSVPVFPQSIRISTRSRVKPDSGVEHDKTDDGVLLARELYPQSFYDLTIVLQALSQAERGQVEGFLSQYQVGEFDIWVHPHMYRVSRSGDYEIQWVGGLLVTVQFECRGVRL